MEVNNPKYRNQGIHVVCSIFTVDKGVTKVLLIRRKNEPFKGMWALVGGALYNDEELIDGLKRELKEKTGIENIHLEMANVYSRIDRSPVMRMVAISYIGIVDKNKLSILKETLKTVDCDWFPLDRIPKLAYDHNEILEDAAKLLKERIKKTDMLRYLYPSGFTMPEIQKVYESILGVSFDRRNFRKKLLSLGFIKETNKTERFEGKKPAKIYEFKKQNEIKSIFYLFYSSVKCNFVHMY